MKITWKKFKESFFGERTFNFDTQSVQISDDNFLVKRATIENLEDCLQLQAKIYPVQQPWTRKNFYSELISKRTLYLLVLNKDGLVAIVGLAKNDKIESHVTYIGVIPQLQGRGIGRFLLKLCIEIAKNKGFKKMSLEVDAKNYRAIELYQKLEFKKIKLKHRYYDNNHDAYELCKDIS